MKKSFFIFCMSLLIAFCSFITAEAATKKVIEKDSQGNAIKTTITETDQYGNETTTIINHQEEVNPQTQIQGNQMTAPAANNNIVTSTASAPATPADNVQLPPVQQERTVVQQQPVQPTAPVMKKGLKPGSNILYGRLGLSVPTNKPDGTIRIPGYEPLDCSWGVVGIELGATYLHYITNYFALGAEFGLDAFLGKTDKSTNIEVTQSTVFANFLLLAHIYLNNIQEESRFYIPIGIGFGSASYTVSANYLGYNSSDSASGSGTCYVIGLGGNWRNDSGNISGCELRYTKSTVDGSEPDSIKDQEIGIFSILFYYGFDF
ncbi:MAG: hypothetical protein VB017_05190 [Endomicrobiaceae bacterium]|nr:hypothetical protein [Endomicrobiaceae bacterium]